MSDNVFVDFVRKYHKDPVGFVQAVFGITPDPWQAEVLEAIASGERRISVRSAHGVGKTACASWAILWYLLTRFPVKVVVTAPTKHQLFDALFAEVRANVLKMPDAFQMLFDVGSDRISLRAAPDEAFVSCRTARRENPEALQGVHSEHVLLIADEASGVDEAVFEAAQGSMSGESATTMLLGNPTRTSGTFFASHNTLSDFWWTRRISAFDSPRVSEEYIEEGKVKWGEESNAYRVRVLGEFPLSDDDAAIPLELVESAQVRDIDADKDAPIIWGVDIARFGSDASALAKRQGRVLHGVDIWRGLDLMQTAGRIKAEFDTAERRPVQILIDSIEVGGGVVDRLRELDLPAVGVNVGEKASLSGSYKNLRGEIWFKLKAWLETRETRLPKDDELLAELVGPKYKFDSSGRTQLESKDEMRKRGLRSPDRADAVALTFARDNAVGMHGRSAVSSWDKPLHRGVTIV